MASRFIMPTADVGKGLTPSDGAKLSFFETGTSTPKNTFTTQAATIANPNPVIADSNGVFPDIFITGTYKVTLTDKNDVQSGFGEADPVSETTGVGDSNNDKRYGPIFATVTAMVAANPVSIDGVVVNLVAGMVVNTVGYFDGWAALLEPKGGSDYDVATLADVRSARSDPTFVPDEKGNHTAGNGLVLMAKGAITLEKWGAKTDGTDVGPSFQAAINFAAGLDYVEAGEAVFTLSTGVTAVPGKRLLLRFDGSRSTIFLATGLASGYAIEISNGYDVQGFQVVGNAQDGMYCFGSASGNHSDVRGDDIILTNCEYGVKIDGTAEMPLGSIHQNFLIFNARTCGIKIATDSAPGSGQSCMAMDDIRVNNAFLPGISASNVVVTPDVTPTTDQIDWSATGAAEFGWIIMQRPAGSGDNNAWVNVGEVGDTVITITITKVAAENFDYVVVRNSCGVFLKHHKAVSIGAIQCEYVGRGLSIDTAFAVRVDAFYSEWRGLFSSPIPRGDGVRLQTCNGVEIGTTWVELGKSAVTGISSTFTVGSIVAANCSRSALHISQTSEVERFSISNYIASAGTPASVTYEDDSFRSGEVTDPDQSQKTAEFVKMLTHVTKAAYAVGFRGVEKGRFGADVDGSFMNTNIANINQVSKTLNPALQSTIPIVQLTSGVATDIITFDVGGNDSGSFVFHYSVMAIDGSSVTRQALSGTANVTALNAASTIAADIGKSGEAKFEQAGTLSDVVFTATGSGSTITLKANTTSSNSTNIQMTINPIAVQGAITNIVQV